MEKSGKVRVWDSSQGPWEDFPFLHRVGKALEVLGKEATWSDLGFKGITLAAVLNTNYNRASVKLGKPSQ